MKVKLRRFSPRKDSAFFSTASKINLPGLKVFSQTISNVDTHYALSVQTGKSVERNAIKRQVRAWLFQNSQKLQHKKIFLIVLNWQNAKQEIDKLSNLV